MALSTIGALTLSPTINNNDLIEIETAAGVSRHVTRQTLIGATLTGDGTIVTNGKTLTINDTGIAALLNVAQTFTQIKTFGAGISFGNETLDQYDRTDWSTTLALLGSVSNPTVTYSERYAYSIRLGNLMIFQWELAINTISGGSGDLRAALPVAAGPWGRQPRWTCYVSGPDVPAGAIDKWFGISANNAFGSITVDTDNGAPSPFPVSSLANGDRLACSGFYLL